MEIKKAKPFPPTLKEKNRYLLIKGDLKEFLNIQKSFLGLNLYSLAFFKVVDQFDNFFLIKCSSKSLDLIRASLCIFENNLEIIRVFGTIKKYQKFKETLLNNQEYKN